MTTKTKNLWNVKELAAHLNLHPDSIYRMIARGKLKFINVGVGRQAGYRFDPDDLWEKRSGNVRRK